MFSVKSVKRKTQITIFNLILLKNGKQDTRCAYSKKIVRIIFLRITLEDMFAMLNDLPTSVTDRAISRGFIFVKLCNHEVRENKPPRKVSNLQ